MTQNFELVYYVAQNVGIIGILADPKMHSKGLKKEHSFSLSFFSFIILMLSKIKNPTLVDHEPVFRMY